ncbi:NAD(P)-dependent oxidoreductase [bacterium]|nr:MAG: NAD(P)-dependent oxidoreductase [bacterium]
MPKVLLTGATGFIGRHCLPLLLAYGWEVHALSSRSPESMNQSESGAVWHQVDLFDAGQVQAVMASVQPEALLHLAWHSTAPGGFWSTPQNFRWVQVSLELMQAFAEQGGKRAVLAGTCAEYDWTAVGTSDLCEEYGMPLRPATLYGTCKHALHLMVEAWAKQTGISAAWGRVFFLYGPHEHPDRLVPATIRALLSNSPARCSSGVQVRDFMAIQDAAAAFVALLQSEVTGAVNIASGQAVAVKKVANCIGELLQRSELIELGALPTNADEPPFLVADVRRLRDEVGWEPHYDLQSGLETAIDWGRAAIAQNRNER